MKHWYYADEARQPQGPVDAAMLRDLLAGGRISHATLIWRDGLSQWQAAGDFAGELGLGAGTRFRQPLGIAEDTGESTADAVPDAPSFPPPDTTPETDASPYAAPEAAVGLVSQVVQGGEVVYAGFWKRTAAYTIDSFLLTIITTVISTVTGLAMLPLVMADATQPLLVLVLQVASYLVQIVVMAGYFAWFHASPHQATPGKMAVGIKVVDRQGAPISFWRAIGRFFATFVSTLLLMAGYLMAAFTGRKQALHDLICGTLVVDKWAYTHYPERQQPKLGVVTWLVLVLGGLLSLLFLLAAGVLVAAMGGVFGK
ncbi:RDD family protein [Pseudomonas sp. R2.Fl]|nr:RDD family protein [Pseudomonas sp. R2.Fl]